MTMSGRRSFTSLIARSRRFGTKCGPPQCRSEMCAIVSIGARSVPVRARWYPGSRMLLETPDFQAYRGVGQPRFANQAELECAKILDFYGVPWEYEPRTFELEHDAAGNLVEAFTPDFFLPEQDLYLEVTVMKQSLVTRKNRKIRKLRERYPDIKIKLFTRRDFERLDKKYKLNLAS